MHKAYFLCKRASWTDNDLEKKNSQEHSGGKKSIYILQVKFLPIIRMLNKITSYKRHLDREKKLSFKSTTFLYARNIKVLKRLFVGKSDDF